VSFVANHVNKTLLPVKQSNKSLTSNR